MTSDERLERLLAVQDMDMKIVEMERRKEEIPRRRAEAAGEIVDLEGEKAAREEALERVRLERRHRESDLESREERLERYERQLNDVKTNVAYSALLTEIQTTKREIREIEDQVLTLMEQREEHETRLEEIESGLAERREAARDVLEALETEEREIEAALEEARGEREEVAGDVDPELYRVYDRLRRRQRFPALVPLRGQACGACYGRLPPQVVHEVTHDGALRACESCGVVVYAETATAGTSAGAADSSSG